MDTQTKMTWDNIKHFHQWEFDDPKYPGSGRYMNMDTVMLLDELREDTDWAIIPHWKVGGCVDMHGEHGHADHSYHLQAMGASACDFHFDTDASIREQVAAVVHAGFTGIGIYYDWKWNGSALPVGIHVDRRPSFKFQIWTCRDKGKYIYLL